MDIYDIKAFDRSEKIIINVHNGRNTLWLEPKMSFYMEALVDDVDRIEEIVSDFDLLGKIDFIDRGWTDVDNRQTVSIEYTSLVAKERLKALCNELNIELFNADIPEEFLWMLEHGHLRGDVMKRPLFYDIECDPTGFAFWDDQPDEEKYQNRIYSIGAIDSRGKERFFLEEDEALLLKKFYSFASNYTCIAGWNSYSFDMPYIEGRTKRLKLKLDWNRIPQLDMMYSYSEFRERTKKLGEVIYKGLDKVANEWLDAGKIDIGGPAGIKRAWDEADYFGLELYCMHDVRLLHDLFHEVSGIKNMMELEASKIILGYLDPNRRYVSAFVDNVFTQLALKRRLAVPQMDKWQHRDPEEVSKRGAGGYVPTPVKGLHFNVVSIDYESLYPTIYMTHNSGVNTVDWKKDRPNRIYTEELDFYTRPRGLNAEFMEYLLKTRLEYKHARDKYEYGTPEFDELDVKQNTYKSILVSANGVLEEKKFRYKNQAIYNSTVKTGQEYLKMLIEAGESLGWELIGGDTDGCHFLTPFDTVEEIVEALPSAQKFIQDYVRNIAQERWNIPDEYYAIVPRCEQVSSHFYYITKKSYVRKVVWEDGKYLTKPRFDAKGMPAVKYNTLSLLKEILRSIFEDVVFSVERGEDFVPLAVDYLLRVRDDLFAGRRDDWLTFAQRVNSLEGRLPHNRAAKILAKYDKFEPGMIVRFIRRANGNIILPDYDKKYQVDRKTYNYYWMGTVARWMGDLLPDVAAERSLGFRATAQTKKLDW